MRKFSGICFFVGIYLMVFGIVTMLGSILLDNGWPLLPTILFLDVVATIAVYLVGFFIRSPSFYDPYWSIQSWVFYLMVLIYYGNWNVGTILVFVVLTLYSARLTANFFIGFTDIRYLDWRYRELKRQTRKAFQAVNFFGIHMMPTLLVYLASIPLFLYAQTGVFHPLDLIALFVMAGAIAIELIADLQMKGWLKRRTGREQVFEKGLWGYSRHPNYLGEIAFWFGAAALVLARLETWYWVSGAVAILLLFLFISIPMEEKHFLTYKPTYADYQKRVHMLLILPKKK